MVRLLFFTLLAVSLTVGMPIAADDPKPGPKEDAAKSELEKLQGQWVCVGYQESNGKANTSERARAIVLKEVLTIKGTQAESVYDIFGEIRLVSGPIKLNPTAKPKQIDRTRQRAPINEGKVELGLYELEGDKLKILWGEVGAKDRPKTLQSTDDGNVTVKLYERKK